MGEAEAVHRQHMDGNRRNIGVLFVNVNVNENENVLFIIICNYIAIVFGSVFRNCR